MRIHFNTIFLLVWVLGVPQVKGQQRRLLCLDNRADVQSAIWTSNAEIKSVESVDKLPKSFGDLKTLGRSSGPGIWYFEGLGGTANPKDQTFKSPLNSYSNKARTVTLYMKYYTNSQKRLSLYPVKPGPNTSSLFLLPSSTQTKWEEVTKEIDPSESPIEITGHLNTGEYVLWDKIVLAVDTPLPSDLSLNCRLINTPPTLPPTPAAPTPTASNTPRKLLATPSSPSSECPALPQIPECKCNCNCNCSKC